MLSLLTRDIPFVICFVVTEPLCLFCVVRSLCESVQVVILCGLLGFLGVKIESRKQMPNL